MTSDEPRKQFDAWTQVEAALQKKYNEIQTAVHNALCGKIIFGNFKTFRKYSIENSKISSRNRKFRKFPLEMCNFEKFPLEIGNFEKVLLEIVENFLRK